MTFIEFIRDEAPKRCGVHPAFGKVAVLVFEAEQKEGMFPQEDFLTNRDRARLVLPYKPVNEKEYERCLDIIEYIGMRHRTEKHGENYLALMEAEYKNIDPTTEEAAMMEDDYWLA